jgi:predicted molibdopterin-dependent oxidoreductase YjgC
VTARLVTALTNLALLTGNVGRDNCGLYLPYSENNLQGSADMGALPAVLTGYQPLKEKKVRDTFCPGLESGIMRTSRFICRCRFVFRRGEK